MHHQNIQQEEVVSMPAGKSLIEMHRVGKIYQTPSGPFTALHDITLHVQAGEFVAIVGKSGSGKSTFINLLTGIDRPSSGEIIMAGAALPTLSESRLAAWRGRNVGIVFQFFQLLPTLTVVENVMLPMDFCHSYPVRERRTHAMQLLERVGIAEQADKLPTALSGGQQQRAAIARALANDPQLLVADEPTGNLDARTTDAVLHLFAELSAEGKSIVLVTHERDVQRIAHRVITLADGAVVPEAIERGATNDGEAAYA